MKQYFKDVYKIYIDGGYFIYHIIAVIMLLTMLIDQQKVVINFIRCQQIVLMFANVTDKINNKLNRYD